VADAVNHGPLTHANVPVSQPFHPQVKHAVNCCDEFGQEYSWMAIAVATDGQWEALRDALDRPVAGRARYSTCALRQSGQAMSSSGRNSSA
jgi:crotonobetainyl-CoA:carnitine CoA-transferase CaiB-like acyl-CoA transferase